MLLIALWIKHYTVSADKSIKYIARPCTLLLWLTAEIPVIVLLFLTAAGSFVSGLLVALLVNSGTKSKA